MQNLRTIRQYMCSLWIFFLTKFLSIGDYRFFGITIGKRSTSPCKWCLYEMKRWLRIHSIKYQQKISKYCQINTKNIDILSVDICFKNSLVQNSFKIENLQTKIHNIESFIVLIIKKHIERAKRTILYLWKYLKIHFDGSKQAKSLKRQFFSNFYQLLSRPRYFLFFHSTVL